MQALLEVAARHRVAVVPFGGGTSVVGGLVARRDGYAGVVSLDLVRMKRLLAVDPVSMTATLEPGLRGPEAEALLAEHGLTLGHFPQSFEYATIGGFAATRSSGQSSAGYGRFDALVVGLARRDPGRARSSSGTRRPAPPGPTCASCSSGSEGAFGVITAVTVRVRPAPRTKVYEGWRWPSFAAGRRRHADAGAGPAPADRAPALRRERDGPQPGRPRRRRRRERTGGCLMIVGFEGTPATVDAGGRR